MANLDNPRGFHPYKSNVGAPWNSAVRSLPVNDAADIFMFDSLKIASGLAASCAADTDLVLGVAVGFGRNSTVAGAMGNSADGMAFDPDNLTTGSRYYDDSASTHTEWNVFYVPAFGNMFMVQADAALTNGLGSAYDQNFTAGSTTTGISKFEVKGGTAAAATDGVFAHQYVRNPENDVSLANLDFICTFENPAGVSVGS
jgi:hypothetical protein